MWSLPGSRARKHGFENCPTGGCGLVDTATRMLEKDREMELLPPYAHSLNASSILCTNSSHQRIHGTKNMET